MPRGVSRAKHPELYEKSKTGIKKGTQKLGAKAATRTAQVSDTNTLHELSTHAISLTTIFNALPAAVDRSSIMDEINSVIDVMVAERRKLFPDAERPSEPEEPAASAAPVQTAPPAFVPPPAPGIHA